MADEFRFPRLVPPGEEQRRVFLDNVTPRNPGIGIIDIDSGQLYLVVASQLDDGDHSSLAAQALGIQRIENAQHLRGFVVGIDEQTWVIANSSGLNPLRSKMEPELFEQVEKTIRAWIET